MDTRRQDPAPIVRAVATRVIRWLIREIIVGREPTILLDRATILHMSERPSPNVEVIDLAPGLWIWRLEHPAWNPRVDWQEVVTCTCVDAGDERWLLDPLFPPDNATQVWDRLADGPPTAVAVLLADHLRETWSDRKTWSIDAAVRRYGCRAFGPDVWDPD